ncbi:MAG: cation:proton antiporter, partial [Verrucomicrobiota bacterium]|nr:cation:proton antiporter [Verrucomicrobiota bacterium]
MELVYIVFPLLLILVVLAAVWLDRLSVPVILVALGGGVLFGSDVLGLLPFNDEILANHVANTALVFILFQGGFGTKKSDLQAVALPAIGMATWGVFLTALATFVVLWKGFRWPVELAGLLAVIISSTDAAATFSILRRQTLPKKLSSTIELESAANDPMAVLLTVVVVQTLAMGQTHGWQMLLLFIWQFTMGPILGWLMGRGTLWLFNHLRPQDRGHYYVLF